MTEKTKSAPTPSKPKTTKPTKPKKTRPTKPAKPSPEEKQIVDTGIPNSRPGMIAAPPSGIYIVEYEEYATWDALNQSTINKAQISHAALAEWIENTGEPTNNLLFGKAFHAATLEPEIFKRDALEIDCADGSQYSTHLNARKKAISEMIDARMKALDEAKEAGKNKTEIDEADLPPMPPENPICLHRGWRSRIESMINALDQNEYAEWIRKTGADRKEIAIVWRETIVVDGKEYEIPCKARIDYWIGNLPDPINKPAALDVKTSASVIWDDFRRSLHDHGYHRQAAWTMRGLNRLDLMPEVHDRGWMICAIEKTPPYHNQIFTLDAGSIEQGLYECREGARRWIDYRFNGNRSGLPSVPMTISLAPWHMAPSSQSLGVSMTGERI